MVVEVVVVAVLWWLVCGGSCGGCGQWIWVFTFIFYLQLCCSGLCLILCSCGGLEYFPLRVINWGVGVLASRVRFFEFLFGYDLGVLAFSMFIPLGLAKLKMVW